ncbi:hypothetical protein SAMN02745883_00595 [Caminicella sporogenes DSM 14501]|uniref:Cof subfamily of IIB subfamily of haloacid dehalogenase superfamily/HAD-superfamily hydrolase, subfamily IIB n=1 Tax=Caminicella sporogenes DSM 14501 TaxID=1121266 RepID=A0A1M6MKR2_9FIRM|nr:Cof-type HAD-IIB family hydrolase [Caminicella sporogenes]RKD27506.1 hypothetical protein BET04_00075 [Caminicella sporogenes]SHJ84047.1 hypothetical protein SAMN02745883_00595 [Caminicella sporogenes DSM 14501]
MKYKLIVTDMDGTLLNSQGNVSDENKKAMKKLLEKGGHIAIATGRIYTTAKVYAKHLGIVTPIICCNGAVVKDLRDDKKIYGNPISKEDSYKIIDICREHDLYFHFYSEDTIFGERMEYKILYFSEWAKTIKEEDTIKIKIIKDSREIVEREIIYKFSIQTDDIKLLDQIAEILNKEKTIEVRKSLTNMLDIMNSGVSKGNAVKKLADSLGIKREEIIAVGDNENDISMIEYAGLGVAMANAEEKVKKIADYITDTNDNDGVAKVIYKFMF